MALHPAQGNVAGKIKTTSQQIISNEISTSAQKKLVRVSAHLKPVSGTTVNLSFNQQLKIGDTVRHEKFGIGTIMQLNGIWPDTKAEIAFNPGGLKTLLLKFARLEA
jgi:DNA helicase-2/ATP-dependent DNA helicase PcrA